MRISDWSSDVCSSDLPCRYPRYNRPPDIQNAQAPWRPVRQSDNYRDRRIPNLPRSSERRSAGTNGREATIRVAHCAEAPRSEEHTSELQSLMRISYAVFCLKKKTKIRNISMNHALN